MLIVQKYGGTSVADPERIFTAARRAAELTRQGHRVVLVVSAQGQTTDTLIETAQQISRLESDREMDAYLAAGEQMSAGLMAMALEELGCPAVSLTGWQAGIETDAVHGNAKITAIHPGRILTALEEGKIVVVAGFQGISPQGDITTLGRGGSDTTAVALAAGLHADKCQIFTDVDGVYDKDPRKHKNAVRFERIGYEDMLALIGEGAQVLHDRSVLTARDHAICLEVLSAATGKAGTIVGDLE